MQVLKYQSLDDSMRRFYESNGAYFRHMRESHDRRYFAPVLRMLRDAGVATTGRRVLDAGSGAGNLLEILAAELGEPSLAVGVDVSPLGLAMHRSDVPVAGDIQQLPFRDGVFDLVVANDVLEHVLRPERAMDECLRVLRRRGWLVIRTQNYRCPAVGGGGVQAVGGYLSDRLRGRRPGLGEARVLKPCLTDDVIGGDRDAVSEILADAVANSLRARRDGTVLIFETWGGLQWQLAPVRLLNRVPVLRNLGGIVAVLYRKGE